MNAADPFLLALLAIWDYTYFQNENEKRYFHA